VGTHSTVIHNLFLGQNFTKKQPIKKSNTKEFFSYKMFSPKWEFEKGIVASYFTQTLMSGTKSENSKGSHC
jgi:hypothetical protein